MNRWYKYIKPYKLAFILGPLCMMVEVIGEAIMPKIMGSIIDCVDGKSASGFVGWLYDIFGTSNGFVVAAMTGMILCAILMMIGGVGGAYFGAKASVYFATDLRADVYKKVQKFSFANVYTYTDNGIRKMLAVLCKSTLREYTGKLFAAGDNIVHPLYADLDVGQRLYSLCRSNGGIDGKKQCIVRRYRRMRKV